MAQRVPARLSAADGRRFALTVGGAFGVLCAITVWRAHAVAAFIFGAFAGALLLAAIAVPGRLSGVHRAWMGVAHAISRVTTPLFMGVIYFLVITPTGLVRRMSGRNSLVHGQDAGSYLVSRPEGAPRRSDLNRQF